MSDDELEIALDKAVYYYFQGLSVYAAVDKILEEMRGNLDE